MSHSVCPLNRRAGVKNGELLLRASGKINVLLTMDRKLEFEHDLRTLSFGVIVVRARSSRVQDLLPLVAQLRAAIERSRPGRVERIGA